MSLQEVTEEFLGSNDNVRFEDWTGKTSWPGLAQADGDLTAKIGLGPAGSADGPIRSSWPPAPRRASCGARPWPPSP